MFNAACKQHPLYLPHDFKSPYMEKKCIPTIPVRKTCDLKNYSPLRSYLTSGPDNSMFMFEPIMSRNKPVFLPKMEHSGCCQNDQIYPQCLSFSEFPTIGDIIFGSDHYEWHDKNPPLRGNGYRMECVRSKLD